MTACDVSKKALGVATSNASAHGVENKIAFVRSSLLQKIEAKPFDYVIANLPYLDHSWEHDPSTKQEPNLALYAPEGGLGLYQKLLEQLPPYIYAKTIGAFEADPRNTKQLAELVQGALPGKKVEVHSDLAGYDRFVTFE